MPCIVAVLALLSPRLALVVLAIFTDAPSQSMGNWLIPLVGFFVLPWTTFAYAFLWWVADPHQIAGFSLFLVILAFAMDMASWFGGFRARSERRS
jgi:hypothetical protein